MATLNEAVMRVVYKVEGQQAVKSSRRQVQGISQDTEQLNAKLAAAGLAFMQFSRTAVQSFGDIETAMARFASRAGWTLEKFSRETEQATHNIARLTGVKHNIVIQAVQEGISQGALQGMGVPEILNLVREGAKLHSAGQTDLRHAVSSAITARQYGAPSAPYGQRLIYSASQVGAGDPAQYGKEYKDVAPGGHLLNIEMSETLGALALIAGAAPSLAEGATWIKALYRTLSNPQEDAQTLFRQRMGYEFTDLQDMVSERGGLNKVVRLLTDNFEGPELMAMFGRQEAVQGLAALGTVPGQLLRIQQAVRENAIDDPVARAWSDNIDTWKVTVERFNRSLDTFMRSIGAPLVAVMKEFMRIMSLVLDALTTFNETFGRVPGALVGVLGALIGLRAAINVVSSTIGALRGAGLWGGGRSLGSILFGERLDADTDRRERERREDERDARNRRNRNANTAFEAAAMGAGLWGFSRGGSGGSPFDDLTRATWEWVKGGRKGPDPWMDSAAAAAAMHGDAQRAHDMFGALRLGHPQGPNWRFWEKKKYGRPFDFRNMSKRRRQRELYEAHEGLSAMGVPDWVVEMLVGAGAIKDNVFTSHRRESRRGRFANWFQSSPSGIGMRQRAGAMGDGLFGMMMGGGSGIANFAKNNWRAGLKVGIPALIAGGMIEGFKWWHRKTADLSSTQVAFNRALLRSNALNILRDPANKDATMRDVAFLGETDVAHFKGQATAAMADQADAVLKGKFKELFTFKEGRGKGFYAWFANNLEDRKMLDAQREYSDSLFKLAAKVAKMEAVFGESPESKALRSYLDSELGKGGNWLQRLMRYTLQDTLYAEFLPKSWTHNPALGGAMDFWHLNASKEFMERHGLDLGSQGIGVLSDEMKRQHAWAQDPHLQAASGYVDANRNALDEAKAALDAHYKIVRENPGIKIDIHIGTLNEASEEGVKSAVKSAVGEGLEAWIDATNSPAY